MRREFRPVRGFGVWGWVLLPVVAGLGYCAFGGLDLRLELMRWWYERFGYDSLMVLVNRGLHVYSWGLYGSVCGPVTLMPVLVAMYLAPRRWAWWVWWVVAVWLVVNPALWWVASRQLPPRLVGYLGGGGGMMDVLGLTVAQLGVFALFASRIVGWRAAAWLLGVGTVTGAASWAADWWTNSGHGPGMDYWGYVALGVVWHVTVAVVMVGGALKKRWCAAAELWWCEGCGYDLRGLAAAAGAGVCPECGRPATAETKRC